MNLPLFPALALVGFVALAGCNSPFASTQSSVPAGVFTTETTGHGTVLCQAPDNNATIVNCFYQDYNKVVATTDYNDSNGFTKALACGACISDLDTHLFGGN